MHRPDERSALVWSAARRRARDHDHAATSDKSSEAGLLEAVRRHRPTILLTTYGACTRRVLQAALPELVAIVKSGTGIDTLDVAAAKELGVRVVNLPEYGAPAGPTPRQASWTCLCMCITRPIG